MDPVAETGMAAIMLLLFCDFNYYN